MKKCLSLLLILVMLTASYGGALADTLKLPSSLTNVEEEAFFGASSLDVVDIPWGTETIGSKAFANSSVTKIFVPSTVISIAADAFNNSANVIISSNVNSYAYIYAEENCIPWTNAGNHYRNDQIQALEEISNDPIDLSEIQPIEYKSFFLPTEGITDSQKLADFIEFNERQEALVEKIDEINKKITEMQKLLNEFNSIFDGASCFDTDDGILFSAGGTSFSVSGDAVQYLNDNYELVSINPTSTSVEMTMRAADGSLFYIIGTESNLFVTSSQPNVENQLKGRGLRQENSNEDLTFWISESVQTFMSCVGGLAVDVPQMLDIVNRTLFFVGLNPTYFIDFKASIDILTKLQKTLQPWADGLKKVSNILRGANGAMSARNMALNKQRMIELEKIRDSHGHATIAEANNEESNDLVRKMFRDIYEAINLYSVDTWVNGLGLWCAIRGKGGGFLSSLATSCLDIYLANTAQHLVDEVKNTDAILHYEVWGVVTDEDTGKVISDVTVFCSVEGHSLQKTTTNSEGTYFFEPLSNSAELIFSKNGYASKEISVSMQKDVLSINPVTLKQKTASVWGIVRDSVTKKAIAGAIVTCGGKEAETDKAGFFRLSAPVGEQVIQVQCQNYHPSEKMSITLRENEDFAHEFTLDPYATPTPVPTATPAPTIYGDIPIDEAHFPDADFRNYVDTHYNLWDENGRKDNILTVAERAKVHIISAPSGNSLVGIKYFEQLKELYLYHNLTELDVSGMSSLEYLSCNSINGSLTKLNVNNCTALTYLGCFDNKLTSLDLSGCTALNTLYCNNNQISTLDLSGCPLLETLVCHDNQLTTLNISGHTELNLLNCDRNQLIEIDVSGCVSLAKLSCINNQLTSLDLSGLESLVECSYDNNPLESLNFSGCTSLERIENPDSDSFKSIDVSGCTGLKEMYCYNNQTTSIDVSTCTALQFLSCFGNQLTELNVSGCTNLAHLNCGGNQLTLLDVSSCRNLIRLDCYGNQLDSLDVAGFTSLEVLYCFKNQLTMLDVSGCYAMKWLNCGENQLTELDVSGLSLLESFHCNDNQLRTLNVNNCTSLNYFNCYHNQLTTLNLSGCPTEMQTLNYDEGVEIIR